VTNRIEGLLEVDTATDCRLVRAQVQSFKQLSMLVTVERLLRKPCCCLLMSLWVRQYNSKSSTTARYMILLNSDHDPILYRFQDRVRYSNCLPVDIGYAAGHHSGHHGSGANYLCLPEVPQYEGHTAGTTAVVSDNAGWLYGVSYYATSKHKSLVSSVSNRSPTPCAVCYVPSRSASVMIPASTSCPADWTQEYKGYVMSDHGWSKNTHNVNRHPTNYICADGALEVAPGGVNQYQGIIFFVKLGCGLLPCDKFKQGWEVACVVCTK